MNNMNCKEKKGENIIEIPTSVVVLAVAWELALANELAVAWELA